VRIAAHVTSTAVPTHASVGFDVIHEDLDHPPFSELPRVLARLRG